MAELQRRRGRRLARGLYAEALVQVAVEVGRDLPPQLLVDVVEHAAEELLRVLLRVALEHRVELLHRPQYVLRGVVVGRDVLAPVALEPVREGHQELLPRVRALGRVRVAAEPEVLLQPVRVGQALQRRVHEAGVAQVVQPEEPLPILLLVRAREAEPRRRLAAVPRPVPLRRRRGFLPVVTSGLLEGRVAQARVARVEVVLPVIDLIVLDCSQIHWRRPTDPFIYRGTNTLP
mmetsp:Transcript_95680/g.270808  ORF Transcript_95680/g.270808 Transcript_95680/m.270808 type:complete len:233 (-) Transcript_95680:2-700(-)